MRLSIQDAEAIYQNFSIETDATGEHWVADKTGENVVCSERFATMPEAQQEWSRQVEKHLAK